MMPQNTLTLFYYYKNAKERCLCGVLTVMTKNPQKSGVYAVFCISLLRRALLRRYAYGAACSCTYET